MRLVFVVFFLTQSIFALNYQISSNKIANGKTALLQFQHNSSRVYENVDFLGRKFKVFDNRVLLPVSYYEQPKKVIAIVHYRDHEKEKTQIINLEVIDGRYEQEKIQVQKSKVILSKKDKKRAAKEYKEANDIYTTISEKNYLKSKFIIPLDTKITSAFGKARIYNGTLKGYHSGTDFRAKVGTPLVATNDGVVVLVKDRFYSGGSVVIDHGQGIYSCYYHMSKFDVQVGEHVKKNQRIGLSGSSGRVTGPHLHFSVRVGGIQVDPLQLIDLLNKYILHNLG